MRRVQFHLPLRTLYVALESEGGSRRQIVKRVRSKESKTNVMLAVSHSVAQPLGRAQLVNTFSQSGILLFTITHKQGLALLNEV